MIPKGSGQVDLDILKLKVDNLRRQVTSKDQKMENFFSTLNNRHLGKDKDETRQLKHALKERDQIIGQYKDQMKTLLKSGLRTMKEEIDFNDQKY